MNSLPTDSLNEQAFILIRLPRETIEQHRERAKDPNNRDTKVGSVYVYDDGHAEFQDNSSLKLYSLIRNTTNLVNVKQQQQQASQSQQQSQGSVKKGEYLQQDSSYDTVANEQSDLFKISLQKSEAIQLGKVKFSTLLSVPKVDGIGVSTLFD